MKRSLKLLMSALAALVVPALSWAATPVATWTDFNTLTSGDFTVDLNGNSYDSENGYVTINTTAPVKITGTEKWNPRASGASVTVAMTVSNLTPSSLQTLISLQLGTDKNKVGLMVAADGGLDAMWENSARTSNNGITTAFPADKGKYVIIFKYSDWGTRAWAVASDGSMTQYTSDSGCKGGTNEAGGLIALGASADSGNPATDLRIHNIAIYKTDVVVDSTLKDVEFYEDTEVISYCVNNTTSNDEPSGLRIGTDYATRVPNKYWTNISCPSGGSVTNSFEHSTAIYSTGEVCVIGLSGSAKGSWSYNETASLGAKGNSYADGPWELNFTNIPFTQYDVVLYMATDSGSMTWGAIQIDEKYYIPDTNDLTKAVSDGKSETSIWGATASGTAYGTNVIRITDLTAEDLTINTLKPADNTRAGLHGFQIINRGEFRAFPAATIKEDIAATAIEWSPSDLSADKPATIDVTANAIITMDEGIAAKALTVSGSGELAFASSIENAGTLTSGATVITADTDVSDISASLGATTVAANKTLTVDTWSQVTSAAGEGTIEVTADSTYTNSTIKNILITNGTLTSSYVSGGSGIASGRTITVDGAAEGSTAELAITVGDGTGYNNGADSKIAVKNGGKLSFAARDTLKTAIELTAGKIELADEAAGESGRALDFYNSNNEETLADITVKAAEGATADAPTTSYIDCLGMGTNRELHMRAGVVEFNVEENALLEIDGYLTNGAGGGSATSMKKSGAGVMTLIGDDASDCTIPVNIAAGTIKLYGASTLGTSEITVTGSLVYNTTAQSSPTNTFKGAGVIVADGCTLNLVDATLDEFTGTYELKNGATITLPAGNENGMIVPEGCILKLVHDTSDLAYTSNATGEGTIQIVDANGNVVSETGTFTPALSGKGTWYEFLFETDPEGEQYGGTLPNTGTSGNALRGEAGSNRVWTFQDVGVTPARRAVRIHNKYPWTQDVPDLHSLETWSASFFAKMPTTEGGVLMGFGTTQNANGFIALVRGKGENKVLLVSGGGYSNSTEQPFNILADFTVPNAETAYHLYTFVRTATGVEIYLDAEPWTPYNQTVTVGNGFQIGSLHGGFGTSGFVYSGELTDYTGLTLARGGSDTDTNGAVDMLRIYRRALTPDDVKTLAAEYSYISPDGSYSRTVTEAVNWVADASWTNDADQAGEKLDEPPKGAVTVTADAESPVTVTMNLSEAKTFEALTLQGSGVTLGGGEEGSAVAYVTGLTKVLCNATIDCGVVEMTGPVRVDNGATLTLNASNAMLEQMLAGKIVGTYKHYLTGPAEGEIVVPTDLTYDGWDVSVAQDATNSWVLTASRANLYAIIDENNDITWKVGNTLDKAIELSDVPADSLSAPIYIIANGDGDVVLPNGTNPSVTVSGSGTVTLGTAEGATVTIANLSATDTATVVLPQNSVTVSAKTIADTATIGYSATEDGWTIGDGFNGSYGIRIVTGSVIFSGQNGGYTGNITIAEGASLATSGSATVPFGKGSIENNGTLTVGGTDGQLPAVSGSGDVNITAQTRIAGDITATGTLTIGAPVTMTYYPGDFTDTDLAINGPSIVLNDAITTTNDGSSITVASGKTISGTGTVNGALTLADGATITACMVNVTGDITALGDTVTVILPENAKVGDAVIDCANATALVEKLTVEGFRVVVDDNDTTIKLATAAVCKIGDTEYATFDEMIAAIADGEMTEAAVTVYADVELTSTWVIEKAVTLDLGDKKLSAAFPYSKDNPAAIWVKNGGTLTLKNGDLESAAEAIRLGVKGSEDAATAGTVTIESTATVTSSDIAIMVYGGSTLTSEGTISSTSADYAAIQGNGLETLDTTIAITGGSVTSEKNHAIYHPQPGKLTIGKEGGLTAPSITGVTGIEMRAGEVEMLSGTIVATGSYAVAADGSGSTVTGAALAISQHTTDAAAEGIKVTVAAGGLSGAKSLAVVNTTEAPAVPVTGEIVGTALDYGYTITVPTVALDGDATNGYTLKTVVAAIGETKYETLAVAYAAAAEGAEITVLANIEAPGLKITKPVTIDFGGYTYTIVSPGVGSGDKTSNGIQIVRSAEAVTLKNGTIQIAAEDAADFYILIQNYADLKLINMTLDGTYLDKWIEDYEDSYTLSVNSGTVSLEGDTTIKANNDGDKSYAFDSHDYAEMGYEAPTVIVGEKVKVEGTVEVSGGTLDNKGDALKVVIASGTVKGEVTVDTSKSDYLVKIGNTYCDKVVDNSGKGKEVAIAAAELFTGIATVDGTTATIDWDFGISDIVRDGNNVVITAKVQKDADTPADYAADTEVTLDGIDVEAVATETPGEVTFTVPLTALKDDTTGEAKTFKVKATK